MQADTARLFDWRIQCLQFVSLSGIQWASGIMQMIPLHIITIISGAVLAWGMSSTLERSSQALNQVGTADSEMQKLN